MSYSDTMSLESKGLWNLVFLGAGWCPVSREYRSKETEFVDVRCKPCLACRWGVTRGVPESGVWLGASQFVGDSGNLGTL